MFKAGELIIYGHIGVCRVVDVTVPDFCDAAEERLYYVLEPAQQRGTVFIPVDTDVFMRPVLQKDEVDRLIGLIPSIEAEAYNNSNLQALTQHYAGKLQSHACEDLIELAMSIYAKKQDRRLNNQKIGAVDESYMKRAEALLYSEFAVALDIPEQDVPAYIAERVRQAKKRGPRGAQAVRA